MIGYLVTFIVSMIPIIELRGAIPIGVLSFHLSYVEAFLISFIGNIIPAFFIVKYIRPIFDLLRKNKNIEENNRLGNRKSNQKDSRKHKITKSYITWSIPICCSSTSRNRCMDGVFNCKFFRFATKKGNTSDSFRCVYRRSNNA